jgi:hypothetical protein
MKIVRSSLLVFMMIIAFGLSNANAGQGEACAKVFLENMKYVSLNKEKLINHCNKKGYTAGHAKAVKLFIKLKVTPEWGVEQLFEWVAKSNLTKAHVDCGQLFVELGTSWKAARLLEYCRDTLKVTNARMTCVRKMNPKSTNALNNVFKHNCKN